MPILIITVMEIKSKYLSAAINMIIMKLVLTILIFNSHDCNAWIILKK